MNLACCTSVGIAVALNSTSRRAATFSAPVVFKSRFKDLKKNPMNP